LDAYSHFDLLLILVERAGEIVGKEELLARVWPNVVVEEGNLRLHITSLRKALGDGEQGKSYIKNIVGRGYCFLAPVERLEEPPEVKTANLSKMRIDNLPISISRVIGREQTPRRFTTRTARTKMPLKSKEPISAS